MMFFDEFRMYTWQSYDHLIYSHMQLQLNNCNYDCNVSPQHATCGAFSCIKNMKFFNHGYATHVMWCMALKLPHAKFLLMDMVFASIVAWTCLKMRCLQMHVCIFMFTPDSF
jgi:hypothetical protein